MTATAAPGSDSAPLRTGMPRHRPAAWATAAATGPARAGTASRSGWKAEPDPRGWQTATLAADEQAAAAVGPGRGAAGDESERSARDRRRRHKGGRRRHRSRRSDKLDPRLAAAADGAKLTPRTREAVVAAAIDRLLADD